MFARLTAKAVLAAIAIAMAFFGVGLLGMAVAAALVAAIGLVWGYVVAGMIFLVPPLLFAVIVHTSRPTPPAPPQDTGTSQVVRALFAAVAKETPWVAIVGAGIAGAADMFLKRNKPPK